MTEDDARLGILLCAALAELPAVRRSLTDKALKPYDSIQLEFSAAQMQDGVGQGSDHYFYLPASLGRILLDATEKLIRAELKRLNVTPAKAKA